jgi:hypothetical protein
MPPYIFLHLDVILVFSSVVLVVAISKASQVNQDNRLQSSAVLVPVKADNRY